MNTTTYTGGLVSAIDSILCHWQNELQAMLNGESEWTEATWAALSDDLHHARALTLPIRGRFRLDDTTLPEAVPAIDPSEAT